MILALFSKITRLLLAVSVSLWMAGGCLFGCSNTTAMGAEVASSNGASNASFQSPHSHDCCTRPTAKRKQAATKSPRAYSQSLAALPQAMKNCPLAVNATATTAKSGSDQPAVERAAVALLPGAENPCEQTRVTIDSSYLPNRGPIHLRCCVFRI